MKKNSHDAILREYAKVEFETNKYGVLSSNEIDNAKEIEVNGKENIESLI